jgi:hypothetical protein
MTWRRRAAAPLVACVVALSLASLAAGCGEKDEPPPAPPLVVEKAERVEELPRGWTLVRSPQQGLRLGAPPGWRRAGECLPQGVPPGEVTVICSPDKLVTLSVSADRSAEALELEPDEFATRALAGLGRSGYRQDLEPSDPKPFRARYAGARVDATGTAAGTGVRQNVSVIVLRREGIATFTAVIAANAERPTEPAVKLAEQALTTLRSQPAAAG